MDALCRRSMGGISTVKVQWHNGRHRQIQAQYNGMVDVARLRDLVAEMLHIYSDPAREYCLPY